MSLAAAFAAQAAANRDLGSPFTARIMALMAERVDHPGAVMARMRAWPGDVSHTGASLPLRLLGGFHALVLSGRDAGLAALYPPAPLPEDRQLAVGLDAALVRHEAFLLSWLDTPPQTNEVRRSAVMIAAGQLLAARYDLPFALSELGASAGLNLMWDRFALSLPCGTFGPSAPTLSLTPEWRGACPPTAEVRVVERRGVDINPMNPEDPQDALRLLSYLWADQPDRLTRTKAAMAIASAQVDRADAADWLDQRLSQRRDGKIHLVTHTVAWQYFPPETQSACEAHLAMAGAQATATAPIARLGMEADGNSTQGAAITLTTWPGGAVETLGRVDFHGRWVHWQAPPA